MEILNSPDYILGQTGKTYTLTIVETFPEDSGRFRVIATNAEGSVTSETNLRVEGEPVFCYWQPNYPVHMPRSAMLSLHQNQMDNLTKKNSTVDIAT